MRQRLPIDALTADSVMASSAGTSDLLLKAMQTGGAAPGSPGQASAGAGPGAGALQQQMQNPGSDKKQKRPDVISARTSVHLTLKAEFEKSCGKLLAQMKATSSVLNLGNKQIDEFDMFRAVRERWIACQLFLGVKAQTPGLVFCD